MLSGCKNAYAMYAYSWRHWFIFLRNMTFIFFNFYCYFVIIFKAEQYKIVKFLTYQSRNYYILNLMSFLENNHYFLAKIQNLSCYELQLHFSTGDSFTLTFLIRRTSERHPLFVLSNICCITYVDDSVGNKLHHLLM